MGFAELAVKELRLEGLEHDTTADLEAIVSEARRLTDMASEMRGISISRDAAQHKGEVFIETIILQTTRLFKPILERCATCLVVHPGENLPPFWGGADEITQVMLNLLTNAWKHTKRGIISVTNRHIARVFAARVRAVRKRERGGRRFGACHLLGDSGIPRRGNFSLKRAGQRNDSGVYSAGA